MREYIDVTARTEDEAIHKALEQLGLERDEVSVEILKRAKAGFLGFGQSDAKVRISYGPEKPDPAEILPPTDESGRGDNRIEPAEPAGYGEKPGQNRVRDQSRKAAPRDRTDLSGKRIRQEGTAERPAGGKGERSASSGRTDRREAPRPERTAANGSAQPSGGSAQPSGSAQKAAPAPVSGGEYAGNDGTVRPDAAAGDGAGAPQERNGAAPQERSRSRRRRQDRKKTEAGQESASPGGTPGGKGETPDTGSNPEQAAPSDSDAGPEKKPNPQALGEEVDDEKAQAVKAFLSGLLSHMDTEAVIRVYLPEAGRYKVILEGQGMGLLIGRRGETLDAIQQLTNYSVNRGGNRVRIQLDAEGYREKRERSLRNLARKEASKVVKFRRSRTLEPMNAYERHVIHTALQEYPGVNTYSTGVDPNRRVVVAYDRDKL